MTEIRLEKSLPSEQERVGQPSVPAEGSGNYFARRASICRTRLKARSPSTRPRRCGRGKQDVEATLEPLLAEPRTGKTVAYIHVPFCETHCLYCGFYNKAYREDESRIYADALIQELRLWRGRPGQDAGPVHAVYMGGGTPTALQADDLRRILKEVRAVLPLANDCEITVEGRLSNFGPDKMEACFEGGANRFSLGVQSFDTEIRQAMGRVSDRDTLIRQLGFCRAMIRPPSSWTSSTASPCRRWTAGWRTSPGESLKLDSVRTATSSTCTGTLRSPRPLRADAFPPGRTSPCSRPYSPQGEGHAERVYRRLSISHWARTSRERNLYNLYVKGRAHCLAFGPGAGGNLDGFFYLNQSDYRAWQEEVRAGRKPIAMLLRPFPQGKLFKAIAEGMEQGWLDMPGLEAAYGIPLGEVWKPVLEQWERAGLVERDGAFIVLTLAGQFWQVNLSQLLLDYLKRSLEA